MYLIIPYTLQKPAIIFHTDSRVAYPKIIVTTAKIKIKHIVLILDFKFMIEPPLAPPSKGGGHAPLLYCSAFSRSSLPLCKGESVGVVVFSF